MLFLGSVVKLHSLPSQDQRLKEVLDADTRGMKLPPPKRTPCLEGRGRRTKRAAPSCETERDTTQDRAELPDFLKRYYNNIIL